MTRRRGSHAPSGSIESLLVRLPERFWHPTPVVEDGQMTGLQRYLADLDIWLRQQLSLPDAGAARSRGAGAPPTFEVLNAIGAMPNAWYQTILDDALSAPAEHCKTTR
jgi:hypothetical protein